MGLNPGWGTKIPQDTQCGPKPRKPKQTNKIQLLLELIPSEVSKGGCATLRSNEFPLTGVGQAHTAKLLVGTVVKRAMSFSEMASFCIWKGMVQVHRLSSYVWAKLLTFHLSDSLIKQARPVSIYKTERFSTLVSDAPCPGKMHMSFHPWKKQSGLRKSFACLLTSTHTNTHSHSLSPTPSTSVHQHLPTLTLQPPSFPRHILIFVHPYWQHSGALMPIHTQTTPPHTLYHTLHTLLTIPPPTPPALSPPTTHPHLCQSPPHSTASTRQPPSVPTPPLHTHNTVVFTHDTNSMTESSTKSSGFGITWAWIQPPAKLELSEPGKNYLTFQSLNYLEAVKRGLSQPFLHRVVERLDWQTQQ